MISYNAIVSEITMFKFKSPNGESVDVVSGRFLERYFNKVECDSKIKTVYKRNGLYKEGIDYFVNYDINCYDKFNFFSIKRNDLYDVVFTKSGANKYINKLRNKELFEPRIKRINNAFETVAKMKNSPIEIFDIITEAGFGIDFVVDLIKYFLNDFSEVDLYEIINGNFEVKTKVKYKKIKGTSVPQITLYIEKAALEYVLMNLYEQNMLTKSQVLFLIRKIVSKQIAMKSCA